MYNGTSSWSSMPTAGTDIDPDVLRQVMDNLAGGGYDMNAWNSAGGSYNATPTSSYQAQSMFTTPTTTWSPPIPSTSSYSTLNGALSPPASNPVIDPTLMQPQPQQPQPPQQQSQQQYHHTPTPPTQYTNGFSYSINPAALQQPQPQPSQQLYHAQLQQQQQSQLGLRPQALHSPVQYTPTPQQQQQHSINPAAFYATPTPPASTSHASPPAHSPPAQVAMTSDGPSDEKKAAFLQKLGPLLSPRSFGGAASVRTLVSAIIEFGLTDVEPPTRLEIVNKILSGAGNNYYRAWMENAGAMEIVRDWLRAAARSGAEDDVLATAMPLLTLLDRLPVEKAETLKATKIGGLVRRLHKTKPHEIPAVRDLAQNIERKWIDKLGLNKEEGDDAPSAVEGKKRKTPPATTPPVGPPAKKAATASTSKAAAAASSSKPLSTASASSSKSATPVAGSSTSRTTVRTVSASGSSSTTKAAEGSKAGPKADTSFFSAPKPKKALPSFKKAPPPKENVEVAKPKQGNAFEEALAAMRGQTSIVAAREGSAPAAERGGSAGVAEGNGDVKVIGKRKRKSVTWAPDNRLEMVKFIERAVYDDDGDAANVGSSCLRDLEKGEGAALHQATGPPFEELVDWTEPSPVDLPPDLHATHATRGASSSEIGAQTAREASALRALYLSPADVPESPAEPGLVISKEDTDRECRTMLPGAEIEALTHDHTQSLPATQAAFGAVQGAQPSYAQQQQAGASVAELLSSLTGAPPPTSALPTGVGLGLSAPAPAPDLSAIVASLDVEKVRAALDAATHLAPEAKREFYGALDTLAASPQPPTAPAGYGAAPYGGGAAAGAWGDEGGDSGWGGGGRGDGWGDRGGRGRGPKGGRGRGKGRGRSRIPCSFYQQGRCKYGDQCDYSHELY